MTERTVYLPAGEWIDFWTGELLDSEGETFVRPAPLDVIPAFVRAGAIIPRAVEGIDTPHPDADDLPSTLLEIGEPDDGLNDERGLLHVSVDEGGEVSVE